MLVVINARKGRITMDSTGQSELLGSYRATLTKKTKNEFVFFLLCPFVFGSMMFSLSQRPTMGGFGDGLWFMALGLPDENSKEIFFASTKVFVGSSAMTPQQR